jgi:hypothetical protein
MLQPGWPKMAIRRMRIAYWITKATDTLGICNTYCSPAATMVTRTHLKLHSYVRWLSWFFLHSFLTSVILFKYIFIALIYKSIFIIFMFPMISFPPAVFHHSYKTMSRLFLRTINHKSTRLTSMLVAAAYSTTALTLPIPCS